MVEFDDGDIDDEIDPALKEKIDRFVCNYLGLLNGYTKNNTFFYSNISWWKLLHRTIWGKKKYLIDLSGYNFVNAEFS